MSKGSISAIIPAAGLGTRMKSETPKFLHKLCGRTVISHIVLQLIDLVDEVVLVVGTGSDLVREEIANTCGNYKDKITFVETRSTFRVWTCHKCWAVSTSFKF